MISSVKRGYGVVVSHSVRKWVSGPIDDVSQRHACVCITRRRYPDSERSRVQFPVSPIFASCCRHSASNRSISMLFQFLKGRFHRRHHHLILHFLTLLGKNDTLSCSLQHYRLRLSRLACTLNSNGVAERRFLSSAASTAAAERKRLLLTAWGPFSRVQQLTFHEDEAYSMKSTRDATS